MIVCVICLILTIPANAETILSGNYDPADYIHDIIISDATKTIRYDFSDIRYAFRYWNNGSNTVQDVLDSFSVGIPSNTTEYAIGCFPFGCVKTNGNLDAKGGALYVGDILPGSPIDFDFGIEVSFEWENNGQPFDITVVYEPLYLLFDELGTLIDTVSLDKETVVYTLGDESLKLDSIRHLTGTISADATYILPFYRLRVKNKAQEQIWVYVSVQGAHTSLSVDVNTVLENSNQMQAIKDKLDDLNDSIGNVGDKIDGTNDRLDQIISGGEAGDSLGAAGDILEDASGAVSDKADAVGDDIGSVEDFESGMMDDINAAFGNIDVASGVGKFTSSLAFISNYVQLIFAGVEEWEVAITLPLFLGLFFGICQHVGGVANMRARQARESRNEELHQARLDKIRNGGSK